jgi:hypothetical protein
MERVIEFVLGTRTFVTVLEEIDTVIIKSKGYVVGQVSLVTSDQTRYEKQQVEIAIADKATSLAFQKGWGT